MSDSAHDHAGHTHGMSRGSEVAGLSDSRLIWSIVLNQLLTVVEVVAGILSGSVSLLSDAAHNFNDANALLIAWIARKISRKQANERFTFGYQRAELVGALINLTLLGTIGLYLIYEGVSRLWSPQPIMGEMMAAASILALVVDLATAFLLWDMSHGSLNVKAAFIHNLVDALGSLAVLLGAVAILYLGWDWIDAALTLLIAGYILWQVFRMLPQAACILMEGAPQNFDLQQLILQIESLPNVQGIHHLHIWQLDEHHRALEAHVVISREQVAELENIKQQIRQILTEEFQITHSTLELEFPECALDDSHDTSVIVPHH